jgi:hypothetical protein
LIRELYDLSKVTIHEIHDTKLFVLVLPDGLWWNELLRMSTCNENIVFLRDLHATLLCVELADSYPVASSLQIELLRTVLGELCNIQPCNMCILCMRFQDLGWAVKHSFEALDEDRSNRTSSQIACQTFMALENSIVFGQQSSYLGKLVIDGDERYGLFMLADKVVDLQVVRGRSGDLRCRQWMRLGW